MKIAHIDGFSGVPWRLAEAQRRLDHEVTVFSTRDSPYEYRYDVRLSRGSGPVGWNARMFSNWPRFSGFDVIHVHGGIWRAQVFYPVFKWRHPSLVLAVHFHGSEARTGKGMHHLASADVLFHSTPDLGVGIPRSVWIPNPIELPEVPPDPLNPVPRFGHFPSRVANKGTSRIIETFEKTFGPLDRTEAGGIARLRGKGAELWIVTGLPHSEALRVMAACDVVVDQHTGIGAYGMVSVEGMAYAKPVMATFRPEWFPGCPIVPLGTDASFAELRRLAADPEYRRERGRAGRSYVAEVHDARNVAARVIDAYRTALDPS